MKKYRKIKVCLAACILAGTAVLLAGCGGTGKNTPTASAVSESEKEPDDAQQVQEEIAEEQTEPFTMFFAGDIQMGTNITSAYDSGGIDRILSPDLLHEMKTADITMVNEEFPFGVGGEKAPDKQFTFKTDPSYVKAFQDMGIDIVSLANNHVLDYGKSVLSQTFQTLDQAGIDYVGAGETLDRASSCRAVEAGGTDVGFLSASRVIPVVGWDVRNSQPGVFTTYDPELLVEQIRQAKSENDLVIVYVHWGVEKAEIPKEYQRELAHAYVDAGADLVIGSHPHVLQGIEYYNGVPIVYSLGNYMFNSEIQRTAVLQVTADEDQNLNLRLIPAAASDSYTYALEGENRQAVLDYIESISEGFSSGIQIDEEGIVHPV